jgi:hypothetical protein
MLRIRALTEILRWEGGQELSSAAQQRLEQLRSGE